MPFLQTVSTKVSSVSPGLQGLSKIVQTTPTMFLSTIHTTTVALPHPGADGM